MGRIYSDKFESYRERSDFQSDLGHRQTKGVTVSLASLSRERLQNGNWPKAVGRSWRSVLLLGRKRQRQISIGLTNLVLYTVLVVMYFFVVLQWLNEPLARLFGENLVFYSLVSVLLILGQGLLLDIVTSCLLRLARRMNGKREN